MLGVSGSGKIAAVDGCIIGTLNITAAVAVEEGAQARYTGAGYRQVTEVSQSQPMAHLHLSSPASTHPVSSLSTSITSVGH